MLFNSLTFLVFLPLVLLLYHLASHRAQNRLLLIASYVFYGWWDVRFLFLIVASTLVDYVCGLMIAHGRLAPRQQAAVTWSAPLAAWLFLCCNWNAWQDSPTLFGTPEVWREFLTLTGRDWGMLLGCMIVVGSFNLALPMAARLGESARRRLFLFISIAANLGILGFFKYYDFFIGSAEEALRSLGVPVEMIRLDIVLPVGISFYTFQTMSYTIDVYRRQLRPTERLQDLALYVAYFPQLVAGPIERGDRLLPIIQSQRSVTLDQFTRGVFLILFGLFKKMAIADGVARSVDSVYSSAPASGVTSCDIALATLLFAVQIYCDFSGYSDIARGTSKLFGIDLMVNFKLPYFSKNPSEFWQRWHISLSSWLRDYLYIPLGGNRGGSGKTCRNLMLTMGLGGLWHGAAWNFVLWGVFQGAVLCVYRFVGRTSNPSIPSQRGFIPRIVMNSMAVLVFFAITCYGWLLFRAASIEQVVQFTDALLRPQGGLTITMHLPTLAAMTALPILIALDGLQYLRGPHAYRRLPAPLRGVVYASMIFLILMGTCHEPAQFIYFQF